MIAAAGLGNVYAGKNAVAIDDMTGANGEPRDPEAGIGVVSQTPAAQGNRASVKRRPAHPSTA